MQFLLGVLLTLCIGLAIALLLSWNKFYGINDRLSSIYVEFSSIHDKLNRLPVPVQNIIHLGFREPSVEMGLGPVKMSIKPEDFKIRTEQLRNILLHGLETQEHPVTGVRAYMILEHAGLSKILERKSWKESQEALNRLLINGDESATKRFLETLADSVAAGS